MAALPISNILGSPISGWLLGIHWLRLQGWRWLFILEGIPAVILGVITLVYLTDWPHQARWLPHDECQWITSELEREKRAKEKAYRASVWQTLGERRIVQLRR